MQTIHIDSLDELPHAAAAVINALEGRSVVVFRGEMGAGKTTLIREIVARLGADDTVTSPTFAIVNQYTTREGKNIYHFDFYRINRLEEAYDFGYEEYFYSGNLCLVEWPEKIEELLPDFDMLLLMTVNPGYSGQKLIPQCLDKITRARKLLDDAGYAATPIEVDGNCSLENTPKMMAAGAEIIVAGSSSVFDKRLGVEEGVKALRRSMGQA